jgi:hypothetical protein
LKARKKRKFKKLYWLLLALAAASIPLVLLLYKPTHYDPPDFAHSKEVSPYLTHELSPQFYNGAQRGEPFDLVVLQKGINDIVARSKWPREFDGVSFSTPAVLFVPDSIVLMAAVNIKGVEFVVTIVAEPKIDDHGLLNLRVTKVKVGAMNITILARVMARRIYQQRLATTPLNAQDLRAKIAGSLLNDEPFEPVFKVEDKKVRVQRVTIKQEKLILRLAPVPD